MRIRVVAPNRHELLVSMAVVLAAFWVSAVPVTFSSALTLSAALFIGLSCAINAVLALDEMEILEACVAVLWLISLAIITAVALYLFGNIQEFANR